MGAVLGFLFAPRPGAETREKIRVQKDDAQEALKETAATLEDRAVELAATGKYKTGKVQEKVDESIDKIKEKFSPRQIEEDRYSID